MDDFWTVVFSQISRIRDRQLKFKAQPIAKPDKGVQGASKRRERGGLQALDETLHLPEDGPTERRRALPRWMMGRNLRTSFGEGLRIMSADAMQDWTSRRGI